jgi:methionyl aminopeptidase
MIKIHSLEEFKKMRQVGRLAATLLNELGLQAKEGKTAKDLDNYAIEFCKKYNTKSACFGYKGGSKIPFPGHICTSINHTICHGVPSDQVLKEGDIIGIDVTLILDGYHGDTCATFGVGKISQAAQELLEVTRLAKEEGIKAAIADNHFGDIGFAVEKFVAQQKRNFYIVEDYCGHGIGEKFHAEPQVQHVGPAKSGPKIKPGMFFTIEPMINLGSKHTRLINDGWTVITKDYQLSAQFEDTIGITENGPEVFTKLD